MYCDHAFKLIKLHIEQYFKLKLGRHMVFLDSLQVLTQSLQTLVDSLAKCEKPN